MASAKHARRPRGCHASSSSTRRRRIPSALAEAVAILRAGGLVAMPTETVYGLAALALDERALARIFEAKGRPTHHPLIVHVVGEAQARRLAASWPERAARLAKAFWPGPLHAGRRPCTARPRRRRRGERVRGAPRALAHPVAQALLVAVGEPLAAPSANRYQGVSPTTAAHVVKELGDPSTSVLDAGPCEAGIESTVVDVRSDPPRVFARERSTAAALRGVLHDVESVSATSAEPTPRIPRHGARHYAPRARLLLADTWEEARRIAYGLAGTGARASASSPEKRTTSVPENRSGEHPAARPSPVRAPPLPHPPRPRRRRRRRHRRPGRPPRRGLVGRGRPPAPGLHVAGPRRVWRAAFFRCKRRGSP